MKHFLLTCLFIAGGLALAAAEPPLDKGSWDSLNHEARLAALKPLRPGSPGRRVFWNAYAVRYINPPAFEIGEVAGAAAYRFDLAPTNAAALSFIADQPWRPLTPVWDRVGVGFVTLTVTPLDAAGRVLAPGETRHFYRAAPFHGPYPAAPRSCREAALRCYEGIYRLPAVQAWLQDPEPDIARYELYCYPSKILSALIDALIAHARYTARPEEREKALAIAEVMADWLIAHSEPATSPLAFFPPTYYSQKRVSKANAQKIMMLYPVLAGNAYFHLYHVTGQAAYLKAGLAIAKTMKRLQSEAGDWPLMVWKTTGLPVSANRLIPRESVTELFRESVEPAWDNNYFRRAERAEAYLLKNPFVTFNWEAQFEDVPPSKKPYSNLQKGHAVECANYLFRNGRLEDGREVLAWCEDQFVVWEQPRPARGTGHWFLPCALEQYHYYQPIDNSATEMAHAFAVAYRATGERLYLEKARALAESVIRCQRPDGTIPTMMQPENERDDRVDWLNCTVNDAHVLLDIAETLEPRETPPGVPPLLVTQSGGKVTTVEAWEKIRRPEILELYQNLFWGKRPLERPASLRFEREAPDAEILDGRAIRKRIRISYEGPGGQGSIHLLAFIPKAARPVSSFLLLGAGGIADNTPDGMQMTDGWPVKDLIGRGYAALAYGYRDLAPDTDDPTTNGSPKSVFDIFGPNPRTTNSWATLSAWAWGASRALDWIETEPLLDASHVAIVGHSRGGKAALCCGAMDPRFGLVIANESGCGGAKFNRLLVPGAERIYTQVHYNPDWFCQALWPFANREIDLPFDAHELLALIAPRLLYIDSATIDPWSGAPGEFRSCVLASPAWELYGKQGLAGSDFFPPPEMPLPEGFIGYHLRSGHHGLTTYDWACFLDFADRHHFKSE